MRDCAAAPFAVPDDASTLSDGGNFRPHDLLRLRRLDSFDGEPRWVRDAFKRAPFVVVRRALAADSYVPVGVRGVERSQRYGTWARVEDVEETVSPEALVDCEPLPLLLPLSGRETLPVFVAFSMLRLRCFDAHEVLQGFTWGPAGSAGFELATRVATATASSDLDLLIRAPSALSRRAAVAMLEQLQAVAKSTDVRIDAQLETPAGGVALSEWAAGKPRVLARHASGPVMIADPWAVLVTQEADNACARVLRAGGEN